MISRIAKFLRYQREKKIEMEELFSNTDPTLIDVREPSEFLMGNIEGSINIPLGSILGKVDEIKKLDKPIVVFCRSGIRSAQAMGLLKAHGVDHVHNGGGFAEVIVYKKRFSSN